MNNTRTIIVVAVLLVVLGLVFLFTRNRQGREEQADVVLSTTAFNQTKNEDALAGASHGDVIIYALNVENQGDEAVSGYIVEANILDLQELTTLTDAEGANYNPATGSLIWTPMDVPENGSIQKKFTVEIKSELPAESDMVVNFNFGNEVAVAVSAQAAETTPSPGSTQGAEVSFTSPNTGPSQWLSFLFAFAATVGVAVAKRKRLI